MILRNTQEEIKGRIDMCRVRRPGILALALAACMGLAQSQDDAAASQARAAQLLEQARLMIGGDAQLRAVTSLTVSGKLRRSMGPDNELTGTIDVSILLPDRFLVSDTMNLEFGDVTRTRALNGEESWSESSGSGGGGGGIQIRTGPGPGPGANPAQMRAMEKRALTQEFTRHMIAWLLTPPAAVQLTFTYAGTADVAGAAADVLEGKGVDGLALKLYLDQITQLPLMVGYQGRAPRMMFRQGPPSPEAVERQTREMMAPPAPVEFQLRLSDYRSVGEILLPHRMTRVVEGRVTEEWQIDKFKINPALKLDRFKKP